MASPTKNYRRTCAFKPCRKKFKGTKQQKYCSASCRVGDFKLKKEIGYYPTLKKLLALELAYLAKDDVKNIVECCLYAIQKWKREKKEGKK